jgi:hypothetical protein
MSVASERLRASRMSERVGAFLIFMGCVGILAAAVLTVWIIHDLDKLTEGFSNATSAKLQTVALAGLTPGMLSLLVLAFGVYLKTRSTDLLFGIVIDPSDDGEDDDVGDVGDFG